MAVSLEGGSIARTSASTTQPEVVEGGAFDPALAKGRTSGSLSIEAGFLRFRSPEHEVRLDLNLLQIRLGGANDRVLFFSQPSQPEIQIFTSDHSILQHPELLENPRILPQLRSVEGKKRKARLITAAVLAALVAAVIGALQLKDPLVGVVAGRIPPSLEVRFGEAAFSQIQIGTRILSSPELATELETLVAPLLPALEDQPYPFHFYIAADETVNAFALPGGLVVLHTGLLLAAETPEELLGVLAHEVAHVTERHTLRQMLGTAGLYLVVQALLGDASGLVAVLAEGGVSLVRLEFSRDFEREADDVGWSYLVESEIDPEGMVRFFEKLQSEEEGLGKAGAEVLSFLSTHPSSEERIDRLSARLGEEGGRRGKTNTFDLAAFQARIREVVAEIDSAASTEEEGGVSESER